MMTKRKMRRMKKKKRMRTRTMKMKMRRMAHPSMLRVDSLRSCRTCS
jgi:hypothetical protein